MDDYLKQFPEMLSLRRLVAALLSLILLTSARTELYTSIIHKFPQPPHPQKNQKKINFPCLQWHLQCRQLSWPNVVWGSCLTQKTENMGVFLWSIRNAKYEGGWRSTTICLTMSIARCKHHTPKFILCLNRYWHFTTKLWRCFKQCPLTMPEYRPNISINWAWSIGAAASRITSGANRWNPSGYFLQLGKTPKKKTTTKS